MATFQRKAKVFKNIEVARNYYKILFECPQIAHTAKPGQFIEIKVAEGGDPLLRRPFGIHSVKGSYVEVLFEVVGSGTRALSQRRAGERIDLIGPLGNGFTLGEQGASILVAGGMGVAPLLFLAERLSRKPAVLIGGKTKDHLLCEKDFKKLGCEVKIATDDGSRGFKGYVSKLLEKELSASRAINNLAGPREAGKDYRISIIYACGPNPMLKEVSRISNEGGLACQVSLEAHMACGIGACLGCVVKVHSPAPLRGVPLNLDWCGKSVARSDFEYQRVCKEGPVFLANQILWGKE